MVMTLSINVATQNNDNPTQLLFSSTISQHNKGTTV